MKKLICLKKIISIIVAVVCFVTIFTMPVPTASAATKNSFKVSNDGILYVGGRYFFSTQNGIYTSKTLSETKKKIASKKSEGFYSIPYTPGMISDGKTIYFTVLKNSKKQYVDKKYIIYSVKSDGKKLKKIKTIDNGNYLRLVAYYKGYIYFCNGFEHYFSDLYKMNVSDKKIKKIKSGSSGGFYFNGYIYCNRAHSDVSKSTLYKVNPKTDKYTKYKDDAPFRVNSYPYFVTQKIKSSGNKIEKYNIYTSSNGKTFKKSKKLPKDANVLYASGKTKYAIIEMNKKLYKFVLGTGKKKRITGLKDLEFYYYYDCVRPDIRNDKAYFVFKTDYSISVQKLSGNKAINCNIGDMRSISSYDVDSYNIADGCLVVNRLGKIITYKLK